MVRRRFTTAADGDLRVDGPPAALEDRRRRLVDLPWVWLNQVHGAGVLVCDPASAPSEPLPVGAAGDALVTRAPGFVLAVQSADCVPVLLWSDDGCVAAAHAGWRGLEAGVLESTVEAMAVDPHTCEVEVGPHICGGCYEFGEPELGRLAERFGTAVRAATPSGHAGLDLSVAVRAALGRVGVTRVRFDGRCTAHDPGFFSWRARRDVGRQSALIWMERP